MDAIYRVSYFCHHCRLKNAFTFHCRGDAFEAMKKATSLACPSGCNPRKTVFEITRLEEVQWGGTVDAASAVFH